MKENEIYGVSMATVPEQPHEARLQKNTLMSRNPCYAATQHVEMVDNECYDYAPKSQPTDQSYSYVRV